MTRDAGARGFPATSRYARDPQTGLILLSRDEIAKSFCVRTLFRVPAGEFAIGILYEQEIRPEESEAPQFHSACLSLR